MENVLTIDIKNFIQLDRQNSLCADCCKEPPLFVSINNAILICRYCSIKHQNLGYNTSYVREIADKWDEYLLSFIHRGGNSRFRKFSNDYDLTVLSLESKYKTKAAEYYRKLILSEVLAEEPPEFVPKNEGMKYYSNQTIFSEFKDYQLYQGEKLPKQKRQSNILIKGGSKLFGALFNTGDFLYKKSKSTVWFVTNKTTNSFCYFYSKIVNSKVDESQIEDESNSVIKESFSDKSLPLDSNQQNFKIYKPFCQHYNVNYGNNFPILYQPQNNYLSQQYNFNYPKLNIQCQNMQNQNLVKLIASDYNIIDNNNCNISQNHQCKNEPQPLVNNNKIGNQSHINCNGESPSKSQNDFPSIDMINNEYINEQSKVPVYIINPYTQSTPMNDNNAFIILNSQNECKESDNSSTEITEQQKPNEIALPQICSNESNIINESNITPF